MAIGSENRAPAAANMPIRARKLMSAADAVLHQRVTGPGQHRGARGEQITERLAAVSA